MIFNSHSHSGAMFRINTGNAAAVVAYQQMEHSAAGAQRNDNIICPAMTYRIADRFLDYPVEVKATILLSLMTRSFSRMNLALIL